MDRASALEVERCESDSHSPDQYVFKGRETDYYREWYHKNKHRIRNKKNESATKARRIMRQFVFDYLKTHPCVECKENDPVVLEFDHIRGNKIDSVSNLVRKGCARKTIIKEINKCQILCANCHKRKTAKDFDWHKDLK